MPLYEYECETCGRRFERIQKFSDPPVATCPTCSGPVRKLFSSPAIQFKGSGFYITDYAKPGSTGSDGAATGSGKTSTDAPSSAGAAKTETTASSSSSTSSTESTPAAKAEPSKTSKGSGSKD